jgi:CSLREA domain-containing protein
MLLLAPAALPAQAEGNVVITVTTLADELNADGDCSLREAVQAANTDLAVDACPAGSGLDAIALGAGVYQISIAGPTEDLNLTGDLDVLNDPLNFTGAGSTLTVIDGGSLDRVLDVHGVAVHVYGVAIQHGRTPDSVSNGHGGGIRTSGPLTIDHSLVFSNVTGADADFGNGGRGGGIYASGPLTLTYSRVEQNLTGEGWAGGHGGGIYIEGSLQIENSQILSNTTGQGASGVYGGNGGGIYLAGPGQFSNVIINGNHTGGSEEAGLPGYGGDGGGVYNLFSLILTDCQVSFNTTGAANAGGNGGGIFSTGPLTMTRCSISNNITGGGQGVAGDGGGIYSAAALAIHDSTIALNQTGSVAVGGEAGSGGGIDQTGPMTITHSVIRLNHTGDSILPPDDSSVGAAIYGLGDWSISDSSVVSNSTGLDANGGGIYIGTTFGTTGRLELVNTTVSSNSTPGGGSGVSISANNANFDLVLDHATIASNQAGSEGQSLHLFISTFTINLTLRNTLIASSGLNMFVENSGGALNITRDYTISSDASIALTGTGNLNNTDPLLHPLADNGGGTFTHALRWGSPAIDAGDPAFTPPPAYDQRGVGFPRIINARVDIGAFEHWFEIFLSFVSR